MGLRLIIWCVVRLDELAFEIRCWKDETKETTICDVLIPKNEGDYRGMDGWRNGAMAFRLLFGNTSGRMAHNLQKPKH